MTDLLKDSTNPNASPMFGQWTNIGRPAALKTGTTDELEDVLAIGYTPQRLTAIWMGNSNNEEMRGISSAMGPGVLWREYMRAIHGHLPVEDFKRPPGIVEKTVCVNGSNLGGQGSGKLPGPYCPGYKWTEKFVQGTEPTTDDSDFYQSCGIRLRAHFPDWQKDADRWAAEAVAGRHSYGRFSWRICGFAPPPPRATPSAEESPGPTERPQNTPRPSPTPRPSRRP
jgi:membrane peptidoglycan carboxypeptidase